MWSKAPGEASAAGTPRCAELGTCQHNSASECRKKKQTNKEITSRLLNVWKTCEHSEIVWNEQEGQWWADPLQVLFSVRRNTVATPQTAQQPMRRTLNTTLKPCMKLSPEQGGAKRIGTEPPARARAHASLSPGLFRARNDHTQPKILKKYDKDWFYINFAPVYLRNCL